MFGTAFNLLLTSFTPSSPRTLTQDWQHQVLRDQIPEKRLGGKAVVPKWRRVLLCPKHETVDLGALAAWLFPLAWVSCEPNWIDMFWPIPLSSQASAFWKLSEKPRPPARKLAKIDSDATLPLSALAAVSWLDPLSKH